MDAASGNAQTSDMGWKETAAAKQRQIWAQAPSEWRALDRAASPTHDGAPDVHQLVRDALSPSQRQITECSGVDLLQALARGDITAVEALTAFSRRTMLAHHFVPSPVSPPWIPQNPLC